LQYFLMFDPLRFLPLQCIGCSHLDPDDCFFDPPFPGVQTLI
jgi:hypothetical protein